MANLSKRFFDSGVWQSLRRFIKMAGADHNKAVAAPPAYARPVTAASNLSKNYYHFRDTRRSDLGVPQIYANDTAKGQQLLSQGEPASATPAPAATSTAGPPTPGKPFVWKNSPVSDYPTKYAH